MDHQEALVLLVHQDHQESVFLVVLASNTALQILIQLHIQADKYRTAVRA
jgi:hypothetical protein